MNPPLRTKKVRKKGSQRGGLAARGEMKGLDTFHLQRFRFNEFSCYVYIKT
jgi:hypothetical protein